MNIFNRIIVVLILILLVCFSVISMVNVFAGIVVLILILLVCFSVISMVNVFAEYFTWSNLALKVLNPEYSVNKFAAFLALLAVFAISVFLLLMEFYRKRARVANISSSKTGNAMVTLDTVSGQIKNEVLKIDGLDEIRVKVVPKTTGIIINMNARLNEDVDIPENNEIRVKVVPKTTGIIINMNARLNEDVDIPEKMHEIINKASTIVSDKLGIKVIKTNLTIVGLAAVKKEKEEKN